MGGHLHPSPAVQQGTYPIIKLNFTSLVIFFFSAFVSIPLTYEAWIITLIICFIKKTA